MGAIPHSHRHPLAPGLTAHGHPSQSQRELFDSEPIPVATSPSLRGVLIAGALATPFWVALYLLLR